MQAPGSAPSSLFATVRPNSDVLARRRSFGAMRMSLGIATTPAGLARFNEFVRRFAKLSSAAAPSHVAPHSPCEATSRHAVGRAPFEGRRSAPWPSTCLTAGGAAVLVLAGGT